MFNIQMKKLREARGIQQKQVYTAIKIDQKNYHNLEQGKSKPSYGKLIAIADFFEVSIDYLVGRTNNPEINGYTTTKRTTNLVKSGDMIMIHIRMKELRDKREATQEQVYTAIKIAKGSYIALEQGKSKPKYNTLIALADYFEVSLDYLVGRTDNPEINR